MSENIFYILDLIGTFAFAIWWAYKAKSLWLNIFAVVALWTVTAIWWGTVRDLIVWHTPLFYLEDMNYIFVCMIAWIIAYFMPNFLNKSYSIFRFADSVWLATFVIIWANIWFHIIKENTIFHYVFVPVMLWIITWTGWGIIRDTIIWQTPYAFKKHSNYIKSAFMGALFYVSINLLSTFVAIIFSMIVTLVYREIISDYGLYKKLYLKIKV